MPFQKESSAGTRLSVKDYSDNGNNGKVRNVTGFDEGFNLLILFHRMNVRNLTEQMITLPEKVIQL
ncbi:MAG: hypothetical protein SGI89_02465 [bacterium]|nr:hypothetical protein [bacterium]